MTKQKRLRLSIICAMIVVVLFVVPAVILGDVGFLFSFAVLVVGVVLLAIFALFYTIFAAWSWDK